MYTEKHTHAQFKSLYRDLFLKKCELENKVLQSLLSLAAISPDEFATAYTKENEYTAIIKGEMIHIIKCVQV